MRAHPKTTATISSKITSQTNSAPSMALPCRFPPPIRPHLPAPIPNQVLTPHHTPAKVDPQKSTRKKRLVKRASHKARQSPNTAVYCEFLLKWPLFQWRKVVKMRILTEMMTISMRISIANRPFKKAHRRHPPRHPSSVPEPASDRSETTPVIVCQTHPRVSHCVLTTSRRRAASIHSSIGQLLELHSSIGELPRKPQSSNRNQAAAAISQQPAHRHPPPRNF